MGATAARACPCSNVCRLRCLGLSKLRCARTTPTAPKKALKPNRWRAERLLRLLIAGERLHPEAQPRELFADHPQFVLRAGFVELVDQPDQRADMLLGQLKELLGCLGRHRTSSGRSATLGHGSALRRPRCICHFESDFQKSPGGRTAQRVENRDKWKPG